MRKIDWILIFMFIGMVTCMVWFWVSVIEYVCGKL